MQAKIQLYIAGRHLEENSAYKGFSLLMLVIKPGSIRSKDEWIHWRDVVEQDQDWIRATINKASALFTNSALPSLIISPGKRHVRHLENINVNLRLEKLNFEPEQNLDGPIAVGMRVYHLQTKRFGEVDSICNTYQECKVKWEDRQGNVQKEASRQSTGIASLYPTPVKRQRQPTSPNETVVVCGGSRKEFVGCVGIILTVRTKQARVRLQSGKEMNFHLHLLHSLTVAKDVPVKSGCEFPGRVWRIAKHSIDDFYHDGLESRGHGFSLIRYKHQSYNEGLEVTHDNTTCDSDVEPNEEQDSSNAEFDLQTNADWISFMDVLDQDLSRPEKIESDSIRHALYHLDITALESSIASQCTQRINISDLTKLEQDVNKDEGQFHEWYYDDWIDMFSKCLELAYSASESKCKIFSWADYCTVSKRENDVDGLLRISAQWDKTLHNCDVSYFLFPIIERSHWSLLLVYHHPENRSFAIHLDSMNHRKIPRVTRFAWDAIKIALGGFHEDLRDLDLIECVDNPQQSNTNDCGPYILLFMHKIIVAAHAGKLQHKEEALKDIRSWEITATDVQNLRIFIYHLAKKGLESSLSA